MNIELICNHCNNSFITLYKHRNKKYCNQECYLAHAKEHKAFGRKKDGSVREVRKCVECGNEFIERKKYERKICSDECRTKWNSKPENIKYKLDKTAEAMIKKYGTSSIFELNSFKENRKQLLINKYGVDSLMKVPEILDKLKATYRKKQLDTLIPKLEKHNLRLLDEYKANKNGNTSQPYNFQCLTCDNVFTSTLLGCGKIPICRKCYPTIKNSVLELKIRDFLNYNNIAHIDNNRKLLNGLEIDIILPDYNIGIEVNGHYYHSDLHGKGKGYHLHKTTLSEENNIKLIQIFEDEIILKPDIVLSRISGMIGLDTKIYARKCEIKEVSKRLSQQFLEDNHIQGNCVDRLRYGLYYDKELVSLITFGGKRKVLGSTQSDGEFELARFCNKKYHTVIGGFSKLLKHFIKNNNVKKIITYADIRWSGLNHEKTVYSKNGFTYIGNTPPNYWYLDSKRFNTRHHRFNFRKDVLVKEGYSKEKTEWEIMQERGYDRIWDCGSMKFEFLFK
jgi:hypothetical protein